MTKIGTLMTNITYTKGTHLIGCDGCGAAAFNVEKHGWRSWSDTDGEKRHHCRECVSVQQKMRHGAFRGVPAGLAQKYDELVSTGTA